MGIALATLAESMLQFALLLVLTLLPMQLVSGPANSSVSSQAGSRKWDRRPFRRWTPSAGSSACRRWRCPLTKDPLKTSTAAAPDDLGQLATAEALAVEEPMSRAAFGAVKPKGKAKTMEPTWPSSPGQAQHVGCLVVMTLAIRLE